MQPTLAASLNLDLFAMLLLVCCLFVHTYTLRLVVLTSTWRGWVWSTAAGWSLCLQGEEACHQHHHYPTATVLAV